MSKPATRIGDADIIHDCETPYRAEGSENVFVNGIPWSRQGDNNTVHKYTPTCVPQHGMPIATGSQTVFVNGKGGGRIGDAISSCTAVAEGSPDVFCG
jgi:uncharacterized Zn-binding protein involved in type VI secretion